MPAPAPCWRTSAWSWREQPAPDISEGTLLDGRVRLKQPVEGYRVAIDPVFLAAAVPAAGAERVIDVRHRRRRGGALPRRSSA